MLRKVTVFSLSLIGFLLFENNSFAQEEGGSTERTPEDIIVQKDSLIVFESGDVDHIIPPVNTPFNIPSSETQKRISVTSTPPQNQPVNEKLSHDGSAKVKESKQDFSFNIIYYLIYKFKQVDN